MKKLNYLFVSDFICNPNSGAAGSLITIGNELARMGNSVAYIWRQEKKRKINSATLYRFLELPYIQYAQIKEELSKANYEVVIISQPYAWLAIKRLKKRYPGIVFINRTHGWELRIEPLTWDIERKSRSFGTVQMQKLTLFLLAYCSLRVMKYSDAVIAASSSDADFIKAYYPGYSDKVFTIGYGLDARFLGLGPSVSTEGKVKFLFAGQYLIRKGTADLISCFKKITSGAFEITFIANENSKAKIERDFEFMKTAVKVVTWMPRNELIEAYRNHDAFLMPSYGEGFGKTTFEAMACGMCIIGYREGAIADFCNESNALICETGDIKCLHKHISAAIDDRQKIKELGLRAYQDVQGYTWEKNAERTAEIVGGLRLVNKALLEWR